MKKISAFSRFFLKVGAVFTIIWSVILIVIMAALLISGTDSLSIVRDNPFIAYIILGGAVILFASAANTINITKNEKGSEQFIVQTAGDGQLRIAMSAVESIVKGTVAKNENVSFIKQEINSHKNHLQLRLSVLVKEGEIIPQIAEMLKKEIISAISYATGIEKIDVMIDAELNKENKANGKPLKQREKSEVLAELEDKAEDTNEN